MNILTFIFIGIACGAGIIALLFFFIRRHIVKEAQTEARELVAEAQEQFVLDEQERKQTFEEIELELWSKVEESHLLIEQKCEDTESQVQLKKAAYEEQDKAARALLLIKETEHRDASIQMNEKQNQFKKTQSEKAQLELDYKKMLLEKTQLLEEDVISTISHKLFSEADSILTRQIEFFESETKEFAEQKAKKILGLIIDRFSKEMSTERGISASHFPSEEVRAIFCQKTAEIVATIQSVSGCDIYVEENPEPDRWHYIQIIGYDPVRRELTRRLFDKVFKDIEKTKRAPNPIDLKRTCENIKTELLRQIKRDGDLIAKELGLLNLHPEVRQVMGSLRFRYSYTQNQYFHCAEVGWFAGLLGAELGIDHKRARRVGMLHDLGKALDHELDGSHAIIGADFIAARNEDTDTVHAVRAHHYDVQPENDYDFLVIAADAISGGRPGARRSTMETYTQKVSGLQEISKRHHGVTDVFVLNGGRECRILVNSKIIDDLAAMKLTEQIAKTIEEEMQYPGQIKVVVVRETIASESTAGKGHHR
ncbi:MAG: HDIG domain-containing metalloprotein [Pseudobdellovibrio sp.]